MSITKELRTSGVYEYAADNRHFTGKELTAIADRIDAEHEEAMQREHEVGYAEGCDAGLATVALGAFEWIAQHEGEMAKNGWIRLPVDGEAPRKQLGEWIEKCGLITGPLDHDGELWHKGDMSASPWGVIEGIVFENGKWFIRGHDTSAPWLPADSLLHYHAPTVEDVLTEFLDAYQQYEGDGYDVVAEYAAKLRLAEGEDA